jgi:N6-L-threonylcarbamoyladenine synthase
VVEDGRQVLSNVIASQIDIHQQYGGVVPEVAARSHIEVILPVIHEALAKAGATWDDIDGIAVTAGPGLLGSLLIGTLTARTSPSCIASPSTPSITSSPTPLPTSSSSRL